MTNAGGFTCQQCGRPVDAGAQFCATCGANVSDAQGSMPTRMVAPTGSATAQMHDVLLQQLREATLGEYEILTELGRGGMATVYLGHDLQLDRKVAVKVMLPSLLEGEGMIDRFKLEARTAAQLSHPHIIPIYAVRDTENLLFFVMKFVEGRPLDSIVKELGQLPIVMVRSVLTRVGEALGYAHRRGVVHRDIKPANLMVDIEGQPVVTDFGIAKVADARGLTMTGATVGTPTYMSPEQCAAGTITGASDQYSLGVVAYEMIAGRLPFQGDTIVSLLYKHCHEPPPPFLDVRPDCPPELHDAVMQMLAKNPADRFPTLEAAVDAIGSVSLSFDDPVRKQLTDLAKQGANLTILKRVSTPRSLTPTRSKATAQKTAAKTAAKRTGMPTPSGASKATVLTTPRAPAVPSRTGRAMLLGALGVLVLGGISAAVVLKPWASGAAPGATPGPAAPAGGVASLVVDPPSSAVEVNGSVTLSAAARDANGQPVGTTVVWTSDNPAVATVSSTGLVQGLAPGDVRIQAASGSVAGAAQVTVLAPQPVQPGAPPAAVARIRVDGAPASLPVGGTAQLRAVALDARGVPVAGRTVTWSSASPSLAAVSRAGLVTAVAPGRVVLTARVGTVSQSVTLDVQRVAGPQPPTPVRAASVAVTAASGALPVGATTRLSATVTGDDGRSMNVPVIWRSANPGVATVTDGLVTAITPGSAVITASADGREASTTVTVAAPEAPRPVPPTPEADPREAITGVIHAYGRALETRQISEVRRVYPGITSDQENGLRQALPTMEQLQVRLRIGSLDVRGDAATATVSGTYQFVSREDRRNQSIPVTLQVTLERGPDGWHIRSMR